MSSKIQLTGGLTRTALLGIVLALPSPRLAAQQSSRDSMRVTFSPPRPAQGTLFLMRVAGVRADVQLSGSVAGEELHFDVRPDGSRASSGSTRSWSTGSRKKNLPHI